MIKTTAVANIVSFCANVVSFHLTEVGRNICDIKKCCGDSPKANVIKFVKMVLRDLVKRHVTMKLAQCDLMVKEYGASAYSWMSIPCVSHEIYRMCMVRSDGIDISGLGSLETILVCSILDRLETGRLSLENITSFQHNLTELLDNYTCRKQFSHREGLHVDLSKTLLLRKPIIIAHFEIAPDPDIINRCIDVALMNVTSADETSADETMCLL